jgi:hypothetical protein
MESQAWQQGVGDRLPSGVVGQGGQAYHGCHSGRHATGRIESKATRYVGCSRRQRKVARPAGNVVVNAASAQS